MIKESGWNDLNPIKEGIVENNKVKPILTGEQAGTVVQAGYNLENVVTFDSTASAAIVSGNYYVGGIFPQSIELNDPDVLIDVAASTTASQKQAYIANGDMNDKPTDEEYAVGNEDDFQGIGTDSQAIRRVYTNATILYQPMAEDITYIDPNLYLTKNKIDSASYDNNAERDRIVTTMISGNPRLFNPKAIRIAKLARAIKDSILAQTNDTNPFYLMPVAELYDRITDYFTLVNRAVVTCKNVMSTVALRNAFALGAEAYYSQTYNVLYTADFVTRLLEAVGRLSVKLVGQYYDETSLLNYLKYASISMLPVQMGGVKILVPNLNQRAIDSYSAYSGGDFILGAELLPASQYGPTTSAATIKQVQDAILTHIEDLIFRFNGADVSIIKTGLAAYNGVNQLGSIKWTGIPVANDLVKLIESTFSVAKGNFTGGTQYGDPAVSGNGTFVFKGAVPTCGAGVIDQGVPNAQFQRDMFGLIVRDGLGARTATGTSLDSGKKNVNVFVSLPPMNKQDPLFKMRIANLDKVNISFNVKKQIPIADMSVTNQLVYGRSVIPAVTYASSCLKAVGQSCNRAVGIIHGVNEAMLPATVTSFPTEWNDGNYVAQNTNLTDQASSVEAATTFDMLGDYKYGLATEKKIIMNLVNCLITDIVPVGDATLLIGNLTDDGKIFTYDSMYTKFTDQPFSLHYTLQKSLLGVALGSGVNAYQIVNDAATKNWAVGIQYDGDVLNAIPMDYFNTYANSEYLGVGETQRVDFYNACYRIHLRKEV